MSATHDLDVVVNLYSNAQAVRKQDFGLPVFATDDVQAGFTETHRIYESNQDAQNDADLGTDCKAAMAAFFSQNLRPRRVAVGKTSLPIVSAELDAILGAVDFYGLVAESRTAADQATIAAWSLANKRFSIVQSSNSDIKDGVDPNEFDTLHTAANGRAMGLWHDDDAEYADLCWMATILSANPDQQVSVPYHKQLVGITPPTLTTTEKTAIEGYGGNTYLPFYGVNVTDPGKLFDDNYQDTLLSKDWAVARIRERIAQLLVDTSNRNEKIPFTDFGLAILEGEIRGVLERGVQIGHFAAGSVVVTVPSVADGEVDPADIAARQVTIQAQATLSGGVRTITINVGILTA